MSTRAKARGSSCVSKPAPPSVMDHRSKENGETGFSLVELLVVCALISILAAVAISQFSGRDQAGATAAASGDKNVASGGSALGNNTTGDNNTASGTQSLYTNVGGSNNTAIGYHADVSTSNLTNATAIGNAAIVNASNKIRLGNSSVTVIEASLTCGGPWAMVRTLMFQLALSTPVPLARFRPNLRRVL